ncbi:hypothetical protein K0504_08390 [Neiella marina]|uniref:Uncharacterized protein n=1 Tax=Neiella holothuriorum TaxID=2870530 RepID=A0ABS7EFD4_9GAMM|nr:hypothetical protein [Neiella holothuriorum]MBW8191049.1 hypothetical protein [Neiella holothuriorum]
MKAMVLGAALVSMSSVVVAEEALLTEDLIRLAGEAKYISIDCGMPLDKEKFMDLTKLYAFKEGYSPDTEVNWEHIKLESHKYYMQMKEDLPGAQQGCDSLKEQFKEILPQLQKKPPLELEL